LPPNYYSDSAYEIPGLWISEANILAFLHFTARFSMDVFEGQ
jgi:hypothetical protein